MSTASTLRSEPMTQPTTIDEEIQPQSEVGPRSPRDSLPQVPFLPLSIPEHAAISLMPLPSPIGTPPQLKSISQLNPVEEELPRAPQARIRAAPYQKSLRMVDLARSRIVCQRLCEDWDGVEPELKSDIDFEKRLW